MGTMDTNEENLTLKHEENFFTCLTCKVRFRELVMFKAHYRSEWHRYNMQRSVNGLSSITLKDFQEKEAIYRENNANQTKQKQICEVCRKTFSSEKQYENHLASKVHKKKLEQKDETIAFSKKPTNMRDMFDENKKKIETDFDVKPLDWDERCDESYRIHNYICLFCDHRSQSFACNMTHMLKKHSFFVPDIEYCVRLTALLVYLEQKIYTHFTCICCSDSGRKMRNAEAVRMHMIDKGHCKISFDGEIIFEYSPFYDYTSYSDDEELLEIPEADCPDDEGYVMSLPSGKEIVHRTLAFYYKQNLPVGTTAATRGSNYWLNKRMFKYISFGTAERKLEAARITARDVKYAQRVQAKYSTQLQFKQNKLQKNFRRQTDF